MKRLAIAETDYSSELLNVEATDIANDVYVSFSTNKDLVENILFGDSEEFLQTITTKFLQPISDEYTQNNTDYDAGQLNEELDNLKFSIYNIICNKLEAMNVKDLLTFIGITLVRK